MSIITLTTDYGLKDHFVGALKGKYYLYPQASIIDISHHNPFNTVEASYIISAAYSSFPKGTVHLIGVDMELNKENQHIECNGTIPILLPLITAFLVYFAKKLFLKEWLLLISTIACPASDWP
jgi:hypothetical protein